MTVSPAPGFYELLPDGRLYGWLTDANGDPAPVAVTVNGVNAATAKLGRDWRGMLHPGWRWMRHEGVVRRGGFEARLRLRPDDRVAAVHAVTGRPLPGIDRRVAAPPGQPRIALIAPVKQEAPNLLEWIAYHRALGVETFVLGDNGGSDHTSELIQALDAVGLVIRLDWRGKTAFQVDFDVAAIERVCGIADVCSITDVDEFLRPLGGRHDITTVVAELFARLDVSAAVLGWACYGSNGRNEPGDGLVIERFTRRAPDDHASHRTVKSLVRPERLAGMVNPHVVRLSCGEYVNDRGQPVRWSGRPANVTSSSWNSLRVDHFMVKSRREFEVKVRRGRSDAAPGVADHDEAFFVKFDRNEILDPMPGEFIQRTKHEILNIRERLRLVVAPDNPLARVLND